ncbi:hypothetical protein K1F50_11170 [Muricauda oceani]|uniref:DUF1579 domain-containing protein n=1 Tax=Flagellimonas oceani TaxID=2698672 RepID=A0A6G7J3E7_9FLAO|nr:hypothetical protein [Allomuricauda oceani]MBW8243363.1 hypothetical protein [Allomuricauda oceani]QII45335.1 hypothetical protein GVT53_11800 [Allomuricauda oceani]
MRKSVFILACFLQLTLFAQDAQNCNCCSEDHRAFDFWIGEWEVVNSQDGSPAGSSSIAKEEDGCVIRENWTSANAGYTGTSLNFFNAQTNQWEQLWVDNAGAVLKLKGNRKGDQMILASGAFEKDGKTYTNRITWTKNDDGTVRQLWEVLENNGTATIAFDGLYRKVQKAKNR